MEVEERDEVRAGPYICRGRFWGGAPRRAEYRLLGGEPGGGIVVAAGALRRLDGLGGVGVGDGAGEGDWILSSRTGKGTCERLCVAL